ncbi:MAG TPA: lipopolysaccharide assembly protein LapA domain-containing protein [Solirubrobacteraceae bacterium]|nr:lipopolysaccharide assembly protein LapA domain-containing protein [Solirubrobacteraceae bacterium]
MAGTDPFTTTTGTTGTGTGGGAPGGKPAKRGGGPLAKENRRLLYGLVLGAIVAVFAVLNLDDVRVNWVFGTWSTPLILVIAVTFLLGAATGYVAGRGRKS